jgi:CHAD domain-containing protein
VFSSPTPSTLLIAQIETLRSHLSGVRDGAANSVHDARIATRRIRELLHVEEDSSSTRADELRSRFKKTARALGRVRDADVRIEMLAALEERIPHAAPWLVTVRQAQERNRLHLMRRLIKRLERSEIDGLIEHVAGRHGSAGHLHRIALGALGGGRWRRNLTLTLARRAGVAADAIEHATGVYFPKRVHAARIALKKLRYAMETANDIGRDGLEAPLRDLKKGQDVLGDLHDRHTLIVELQPAEPGDGAPPDPFMPLVRQVLEAEIEKLHARYIGRRERLLEICRQAQTVSVGRVNSLPSLVTAGALALGTGLIVTNRR